MAKKQIGPERWVMTLYYVVAGYWIFSGIKQLITSFQALAATSTHPELAPLAFIVYVVIAVGAFQCALGAGLLLRWDWARGVVNFFCWIRILLAAMSLYSALLMAVVVGPVQTILSVAFGLLDIIMAGLQIWLIAETDYMN